MPAVRWRNGLAQALKAPFPWFGGKSRVARLVWDRFGNCDNFVEPFAGSLAVLLGRPHAPQTETVNDLDCYLANFWRALSKDPVELAEHADWPVNEADLHARHLWLVNQTEFRERMKTDPDFYDVKIAGWWVWGISQWIGSGWCSRPEWTGRTNAGRVNRGVHRNVNAEIRPFLSNGGMGVHRQLPQLSGDSTAQGRGVFSNDVLDRKRPMIHGTHIGKGVHAKRANLSGRVNGVGVHADRCNALLEYFYALADRLRRVRVCCGDWTRVLGPSVMVKHGVCGIFLDPPYDMRIVSNAGSGRDGAAPSDGLYSEHDNELSAEVRKWALENGNNPLLRIALCGYQEEHDMPEEWECVAWKAQGGYGNQGTETNGRKNAGRERIWFSPHCLKLGLFGLVEFESANV